MEGSKKGERECKKARKKEKEERKQNQLTRIIFI